jgi:predicted dinucleotide-binding enzyme
MKVGILGSGNVGKSLASGFVGLGDDVKLGSREGKPGTVPFADAAKHGELLVLATPWAAAKSVIESAGVENFAGKVVIDAINPIKSLAPPELAPGNTDSGGEQVQRWLPGAKVVKAFNTVGQEHMVNPQFPGGPPDMFIAGNDAEAKKIVGGILKKFGWGAIDMGPIESARVLEALAVVWVKQAMTGGRNHAFKMLRK